MTGPQPSAPRRPVWRALARLAWRESRTARRRLLLYMSSISLGVAALVAIDSFSTNVRRSVREQSRALLGGDLSLLARRPFTPRLDSLLDSLARAGTPSARVTQFASMGVVVRTGNTRLVQVRAVDDAYPFYGQVTTDPAGRWAALRTGRAALVDPSLLVSLDARVGDTLALGFGRFVIAATLREVPGDPGITAAIGPRVFIPARHLFETGLLVFGSRAEYEALLRLPEGQSAARLAAAIRPVLDSAQARARTVAENEANLTQSIDQLSRFLAIVGLVALLLGGVGVASGVNAFVMRKIDTVAVLRTLGATSRQVLAVYVLQAAAMGLLGAAAGALLGLGVQLAAPRALGDFLPVDVTTRIEPVVLATGVAVGLWVALVFALRPLVALRRISPLQTLRRDTDADALRPVRSDWARLGVTAGILLSVVGLALARAESARQGAAFALGVLASVGLLWGVASLMSHGARRAVRPTWPFVLRQGIANLYRPANQTRAVVVALGFGVFLVSTVYQLQRSLVKGLGLTLSATSANVVFFDVQGDQATGVDSLVRGSGTRVLQSAPVVPMRISAINGVPLQRLLTDTARAGRAVWPLRREYRSTWRDTLVASERLTAGEWFDRVAREPGDTLPGASWERDVARELGLALGDVVTWDVQGVPVASRVTSFREVNWARFEPNFFVVFEPRALAAAPAQFVILARSPSDSTTGRLQRAVVARFPNVSTLDLTLIQATIAGIVEKVTSAIRFMALLSLGLAVPVLFSAVAATRRERVREGVLLKTLGATRRQIGRILLAEYAALGALGSVAGVLLSLAAAWALTRFVFEGTYRPSFSPAAAVVAGMTGLAVAIGVLTGRDVFRETPLAALRAE
ncbi:MAG TPA: FtsX-like permease family protein [Gemmatimonadaceae bacterium]|nr:FtsX-like permease family protein [Gemmatimonadaceae bacterium]